MYNPEVTQIKPAE